MHQTKLYIYDDENNYNLIRSILLDVSYGLDNYVAPNFLHFRSRIYYFKRIYIQKEKEAEKLMNTFSSAFKKKQVE